MEVFSKNPKNKKGVTVLELVIYIVLFALLMAGFSNVVTWYKHAQSGIQRLDILHQIRNSAFQVSEEISYGTQILFPPNESNKNYHQLVYKNNANEIVVLFRNEKEQLVECNLMKKARGQPYMKALTHNTIKFDVKRPSLNYVEYDLTIKDEKGKEFTLANSIRLRNVLK